MPTIETSGEKLGRSPRSYSKGRPYGPCIWIVIHTTDGSERPDSAEDGNVYDSQRTDGTSTHVFIDENSVVREVNSWDRSHAALTVGNNRGYQVELCGLASQTASQWSDVSSIGELLLAAQHTARMALKLGIPAKWLTKADVDARRPGFITHKNVTDWLEGTHTDPGPNFPYTPFINQVKHWMSVYSKPVPIPPATQKDVTMRLFSVPTDTKNPKAIYKTDGVEAWWVDSMDEVNALTALFGPVVAITVWPKSITLVNAIPTARVGMAPHGMVDDTHADSVDVAKSR